MININEFATKHPLALAFVGDAVWTLIVRERIVASADCKPGELHARTSRVVCASAQSKFLETIEPHLAEIEQDIAKRARNAHNNTVPKNASLTDYKRATAFEAVLGFNHLCGSTERINELINKLDF